MDHNRNFYEALVKFLNHVCETERLAYERQEGEALTGPYWMKICQLLDERGLGYASYGSLSLKNTLMLPSVIAEFSDKIDIIASEERSRSLSDREKIENIKYGRAAYDLSVKNSRCNRANIVITSIVALGQIIQWIVMLS